MKATFSHCHIYKIFLFSLWFNWKQCLNYIFSSFFEFGSKNKLKKLVDSKIVKFFYFAKNQIFNQIKLWKNQKKIKIMILINVCLIVKEWKNKDFQCFKYFSFKLLSICSIQILSWMISLSKNTLDKFDVSSTGIFLWCSFLIFPCLPFCFSFNLNRIWSSSSVVTKRSLFEKSINFLLLIIT